MPDAGSTSDINVRSDSYWIVHALGECGGCRAATRFVALALPPRHQSLTLDWDVRRDEFVSYRWETAESSAFLFYIEYLSDDARRRLQAAAPSYRFALSERTQGSYWANHCASCGAPVDDHDLFCEPDGAFLPTSAATASAVTLVRVEEVLEAGVVGYACSPQFFESMLGS
ncbi:MAG: hypothetical protein ABSG30_09000 [Steroidobacteraceae bacterium]|jgi:hypothetical protein